MKKKLIGMFFAIFMAAALLPVSALADSPMALTDAGGSLDPGEYILNGDVTLINNIIISSNVTIDLNGHALVGIGSGTVITVEENAVFILTDNSNRKTGKITGGRTKDYDNGGGVCVNGGSFIMNGGNITGNTAENGGGVFVQHGSFTMNDGKISSNTAVEGGGVYVDHNVKFIMNGGTIIDNTAEADGGGVYCSDFDVILGGTAKIIYNIIQDYNPVPQNAYLKYGSRITLGNGENGADAPKEGMYIGVTISSRTGPFTTNGRAEDVRYFSADKTAYAIQYNEGGYLELVEKVQEEPVEPETDDPAQPEETNKAPATGITESNTALPAVLGMIGLAVIGAGLVLIRKREQE